MTRSPLDFGDCYVGSPPRHYGSTARVVGGWLLKVTWLVIGLCLLSLAGCGR